ncbi:hypothetical protein EVAR_32680_1 [Eumeta japonica]|uniref:Uncharacterized protein n=1 Tax=Eumeta variegata TaxID=151549 RepID=A0A4C1VQK9_EUMVA|nr:hypothetical protein EVAR_32680_1 [Eumeta japonica]
MFRSQKRFHLKHQTPKEARHEVICYIPNLFPGRSGAGAGRGAGVRKLTAALAGGARAGTWHIEARCGGANARVALTVNGANGANAPAAPAAEQHYVELRFADSMRRRYKPGLPFVGRSYTFVNNCVCYCRCGNEVMGAKGHHLPSPRYITILDVVHSV